MLGVVKSDPQDVGSETSHRFERRTDRRPGRRGTPRVVIAPRETPCLEHPREYPGQPAMRVGQYKPNLRIAELRKALGMTQAELAEKAQLGSAGRAQIARFETRSRTPTWDTLVKIAVALGCKTVNELFGRMPVSRPRSPAKPRRPKK